MAYRQILTSISIDGIKGVFAQGYIYSANLEMGYTDGPSKLSISCMLPDNSFGFDAPAPDLSGKLYNIMLGANSFFGYLLSVEHEISAGQKMLHCVFIDKSIILDQYQIGIQGRHAKNAGTYGNLIVVPSTANKGGNNDPTICVDCESYNLIKLDQSIPENQNDETCGTNDLVYSFGSLIGAISDIIPISSAPFSPGQASYTGSVREVLNNWCSDLGYTFFVDSNGFLKFINLSYGLGISMPILDFAKIKTFRQSSSLEGSYANGLSTFSLTPTKNYTVNNQQYHQLTFNYVGHGLDLDTTLGAWGMADSSARDLLVLGSPRAGVFNNTWNPSTNRMVNLHISTSELTALSDLLGDQTLPDAINKGYTSWVLCYYSDQLKASYVEQERTALETYGHQYALASGSEYVDRRYIDNPNSPPKTGHDETECKPNLRKNIDYSYYPDFGTNLRWYKNVGPMTTTEKIYVKFTEPMVIAANTELVNILIQKNPQYAYFVQPNHPLLALVGYAQGAYTISVGPGDPDPESDWEGRPTPNSGGNINTGEEERKFVNTKGEETACALKCESSTDPCAAYVDKCNVNVYGVYQGIADRAGPKIGNVILPSTSTFYGWAKADISAAVTLPGSLEINGPNSTSSKGFYQSKYTLVDVSNGPQKVSIGGGSGAQSKVSFEIIGFPEDLVLKPEDGLSRVSINFGTEGIITNVEYSTRPEVPPKQEVTLQNVTPRKLLF